jgi:hypothetical protein
VLYRDGNQTLIYSSSPEQASAGLSREKLPGAAYSAVDAFEALAALRLNKHLQS